MKNELGQKKKKTDIIENNLVPDINSLVKDNLQSVRTKEIKD